MPRGQNPLKNYYEYEHNIIALVGKANTNLPMPLVGKVTSVFMSSKAHGGKGITKIGLVLGSNMVWCPYFGNALTFNLYPLTHYSIGLGVEVFECLH